MTTPPLDLTALNLRGLRLAVEQKNPQDNFTIGTDHMAALLDHVDTLAARAEAAEKKVAAVREVCDRFWPEELHDTVPLGVAASQSQIITRAITRALDTPETETP